MSKKFTWLEKLELYVPGFSGYKKRELIREDDRLLRNYLVKLLTDAKNYLEDAASIISEFDFTLARKINVLASNVRLICDKLKFAESGYAPHYNIVKVDILDLERMKSCDEELVSIVNDILDLSKSIRDSASTSTIKSELISKINDNIAKVNDVLDKRFKILRGM
ncbi:MAG: hypothetical protein QXE58_02085 [Candidatus Methanomethylicia archaeon]